MKARYTNISIPIELAMGIDDFIKSHEKLGFRSRAQLVIHSLRQLMIEGMKKTS